MPRDLSHFEGLARLLDLERGAERARLEEERAALPLGELEARGLVLLDVEAFEDRVGLGGRALVTFRREDQAPLRTRLSPGDLVTVSPRKAEVDTPPSGVVAASSRVSVQVAFERPPPPWVNEGRLRLDRVANDVTWERARRALTRVAAMDQGQARDRREVLLGNLSPRFEKPAPFEPTRPLNAEQVEAVALALSARDLALVHGPPGTGKSTVLSELAVQLSKRGKRILCTAASNAAVDHLLELCLEAGLTAIRVGHPARVLPHLQEHTLDLTVEAHPDRIIAREMFEEAFDLLGYARRQRVRGRSPERFSNAREAHAEARKLMRDARALERKAVAAVLDRAQVVCATCTALEGHVLESRSYDVALLDEATQATEPLALMAFLKAPTVILAGDPQQLAPTVLSLEAQKLGLGVSLFERLLGAHGEGVKRLLREQYRMSERLMAFPSRETYRGELRAHPSVATRTLDEVLSPGACADVPPLLFLDTAGKGFEESAAPGTESLRNEGEAELVAARARELVAAGLDPRELGVITPYRAQASLLRERLEDLPDVEVDTVDAFQGREKDAVLVSLVRSNPGQEVGFLADLRRMNVAITRAKRHLFVVGDSATISFVAYYQRFVEEAQAQGGYRSAWEWPAPK
ncbi:MAG: AAA domain-containing protein [Myxococcaceae bacterium]